MATPTPQLTRPVADQDTAVPPAEVARADGGPANPRRIAAALAGRRLAAARCLADSVAGWNKYRDEVSVRGSDLDRVLKRHYVAYVDYLITYFRTGDATYRDLYVGEKIRQAYSESERSAEQQVARRQQIAAADERGLTGLLRDVLPPADLAHLGATLREIAAVLTTRATHTLEVLFVGDCLFSDVMAFLPGAALADEVSVNPTLLASKNPVALRGLLRDLADHKFDLVFYSPFTYEFSPEYARVMTRHYALASRGQVAALVDAAMANVTGTLDLISDLFECNVYVHNSSNVRRHDSTPTEWALNLLTLRTRRLAAGLANDRLADYLAKRNAATHDHLVALDERPLLATHGAAALGRLFYDTELQHPAAMGKFVAHEYRDVLAMHVRLSGKKVVVCDLDNTLWDGVIGEGPVAHFADRQRVLKRLQAKGVVLAISSKNDPKNVHFTGGVLTADDFVCAMVNWDPKVANFKRIAQQLNLKTKDFVFVDDRSDERAMVRDAHPEVQVLDATSPRDWRLLELWADALPSQGELDRTLFYKQRAARQSLVVQAPDADPGAVFRTLGITVDVRDANRSDLKRAVELINRTNQFNTNASRTTLREATAWLAADDRQILVVDAADKFGPMGTVCIAVVHVRPDAVEISAFVLSCRVFGYGIEDVVVNTVKRLAAAKGLPVVGPMTETAHNQPCRAVYANNGFARAGSVWTFRGEPGPDPDWLLVRHADAALQPA